MASLTFGSCKNNAKGGPISCMIYSTQFSLLQALSNFTVLTQGDMIEMAHNSILFGLLVMEKILGGEGISILDTDLEVDLAPPVVYVELEPERRKATPQPTSPLLPRVVCTRADIYCSFFESAFISPAAARQSRRFAVVLYFRYCRSSAATSTCRKLHYV